MGWGALSQWMGGTAESVGDAGAASGMHQTVSRYLNPIMGRRVVGYQAAQTSPGLIACALHCMCAAKPPLWDTGCCAGTRFMVDGFAFTNAKCSHYFLTHYHSDHTVGLGRRFTAGTIYCSPVTCVRGLSVPMTKPPVACDSSSVSAVQAHSHTHQSCQ